MALGRSISLTVVALLACGACSSSDPAATIPSQDAGLSCGGWAIDAEPGTCNGSALLCGRGFDQVAFATAHNAMSNADDQWLAPNHLHGMKQQLLDGVRGFMLDTHYDADGVACLCHSSCVFGSVNLVEGLRVFAQFLQCNPRQVLTLIIESYVSGADTAAAFAEAGLLDYVYAHPPSTPWPTLETLLTADRRVVVLSDEGGQYDWYLPLWDHAWETDFSVAKPADFTCEKNRGSLSNPLFILNHFLTAPLADLSLAEQVNYNPLFIERAQQCQNESGRLPNFVTVDFYSVGDLFEVVRTLNEL